MLIFPPFLMAKTCGKLLSLLDKATDSNAEVIEIEAKDIKFVDPFALCVLAAFCDTQQQHDKQINVINMPDGIRTYLSRMDLFKQCGQEEADIQRNDRSTSLMEIQCLQEQRDVQSVANKISEAIAGETPDHDENAQADEMTGYFPHEQVEENLRYMFNELLENALTHGRKHGYESSKVWVACQYYPNKDVIRIGIVDSGCGFRTSLQNHSQRPQTDEAASRLALEPRISCNRDVGLMNDSVNQGIGLTAVHRMIKEAGGTMVLLSGQSLLEVTQTIASKAVSNVSWLGVGIAIDVPRTELKERLVQDVIGELSKEAPQPQSDIDIRFI